MRSLFADLFPPSAPRKKPPLHYNVELAAVSEEHIKSYVQLTLDEDTQRWLDDAHKLSWVTNQCGYILGRCFSATTANGIANRGHMHVLSKPQVAQLLGFPLGHAAPSNRTLLDIGAGDGGVTKCMAPFFSKVFATEHSYAMQWRLWQKGYTVIPDSDIASRKYTVCACLNVLDRCDKPLSLLRLLRDCVEPDGYVLLAVVLPWCPFVETGTTQKPPSETLPMTGGRCPDNPRFETCVSLLFQNVLEPAGFEVVRWGRVPYLCEGDDYCEHYVLDDVVAVLRVRQN